MTLDNFGCVYLTEAHMRNEPVVFAFGKERGCSGFSLILEPYIWLRQLILFRKNIENGSVLPHMMVREHSQKTFATLSRKGEGGGWTCKQSGISGVVKKKSYVEFQGVLVLGLKVSERCNSFCVFVC